MFYLISKTFTLFLSPITWIGVLLLIAYRTRKKGYLYGALAVFLIFTNAPLCDKVIVSTTRNYNNAHFDGGKRYKLAIVLGGFGDIDPVNRLITYSDQSGRLMEAIRFYKKGTVQKILITGDYSCNRDTALFYNYMRDLGIPDTAFIIERYTLNTRQNVAYSMPLIRKGGYREQEALLITSALHMKRSLACFAKEGFRPGYYSVDTHQGTSTQLRQFYPNWKVAVLWQAIINEWIGNGVYRVVGYS